MLKNLSIKKKLLLIMGIPLLILILFTAKLMFSSYQDWSTLKKLEHVVILSTKIGNFVHETQKERGMTAGFLGSKGAKFSTKLPLQRQLTNKKKEEFIDFLSTFNKQNYGKEFNKSLNIAEKQLTKLSEIRKKVSGLNISTKQAIAYYTNLNSYLLNTISSITKLSTNAEISQDLVSYLNFLLSKERAGIERAVGTNTFARDNFGPGMKAKFYTLVAEQNAYMDSFLKVTNDFSKRFYFNTLKGNAVEEVNRMRHIALFEKNQAFGVDASYWFKTITSKINLLKKVENYLEATLTRSIRNEKQKAQNDLLLFGLVSFISILFTLYLAKIIAFKILNDLYTLKDGLLNFFSFLNFETKEIQSINLNSRDELGEMACALNENIKKTQDNLKLDKELIDDTISIAGKINKGYLDVNISKESNNPLLSELKTIINEMLNTLNVNISNVMNVLNSYSKLDYRPKLETNDLEGIIKDLEQDVDILRDSITQTLIQNKKDGLVLEQNSKLLSQNMNDISLAANQQAASLEETAASLEEITSNITNNTQTAAQMLEYGSKVKSSVSTGQELANKTALSMDEINTQTTAITEAITVIDQIAFQTNILSLNAAVEAATAGEAGKGFAVVAQEVRNLASRSAEAAKEIKDIVETAQTKASEGKSIADNMIEGYNSLNEDITNTLSLIENVANASSEQSQGINQINDTINKLDHITQENAQHASMADNIATKTADIAQVIVQNANAKEFEGKNSISVRKEVVNELYQGIEKRQVERKIKKIPEYKSTKIVEENSNSNDEWESF